MGLLLEAGQYFATNIILLVGWYLFCRRNTTEVLHRERFSDTPGTVYLAPHWDPVDGVQFGSSLCRRNALLHPRRVPYNVPKNKDGITNRWYLRLLLFLLRSIPVSLDGDGNTAKDPGAFFKITSLLKSRDPKKRRSVLLYPAGTRQTNMDMPPFLPTVSLLLLRAKVPVQLFYTAGMHDVQPYRKSPGDPPRTWLGVISPLLEWIIPMRKGRRLTTAIGPLITPNDLAMTAGTGSLEIRCQRIENRLRSELQLLAVQASFAHQQRQ